MVILSEAQRSRNLLGITIVCATGFLDFARNDRLMEIIPLGDSALIVRVREQFEDAPEETLDEVLRVFQLLQRAAIPGVIELAPAYTSVAVFFDPIAVIRSSGATNGVFDELATRIRTAIIPASRRHRRRPRRVVRV